MNWYKAANLDAPSIDAQWINSFAMAFSMADPALGHFQQVRASTRPGGQVYDLVFANLRDIKQNKVPQCTVRLQIDVSREILKYQVQMGSNLLDADSVNFGSELIPQVAARVVNSAMMLFKSNLPQTATV